MNLSDMKISGVNRVSVTDSLNAPILHLKMKNNANTLIPNNNDIKIMVENSKSEVKTILFHLNNPLRRIESVSDEFIIEPNIKNKVMTMRAYVKRYIKENTVMTIPIEEDIPYQSILLFQGINILETNYQDATLEIVYPKENDLNTYYISQALYLEQKENPKDEDLYFKDAFTKVENQLNLEVNQIKTDCLVSKNNKFSLDELGNLSVNKITTAVPIEAEVKLLSVYPVGSIYISVNNTNPGNVFGGTWQSFGAGRTLVGFDSSQPEFDTIKKIGGEKTHTLTPDELARHEHFDVKWAGYNIGFDSGGVALKLTGQDWHGYDNGQNGKMRTGMAGGDYPHNNLQPYITVYMWLRIS